MCGRYTIYTDEDERELLEMLRIIEERGKGKAGIDFKTGEIFPSDRVPLLMRGSGSGINIAFADWGFNIRNNRIINARRETAAEKPSFRDCLISRRCIVPSTGFFEWDSRKEKYLFNLPDTKMLYMAGLWRKTDKADEFVILTANANESVEKIHDRMPLILQRENFKSWLYDDEYAMSLNEFSLPGLRSDVIGKNGNFRF